MRFRNVSADTQDLPTLDLRVGPGEEFEATGDAAKGLAGNLAFAPVGAKTTPAAARKSAAAGTAEAPQTATHDDKKVV